MKTTKSSSLSVLGCFKQFLLALAVIGIFFGLLLFENERKSSPHPKAVRYWIQFRESKAAARAGSAVYSAQENSSRTNLLIHDTLGKKEKPLIPSKTSVPSTISVPSTPSPIYFEYRWTTSTWGRKNKTAWHSIYGDIDCPDNSRRGPLTAILKRWSEIAKKHHIRYALFWGSLIGIVRNNDVVPWDHDMDLLVHYKDIVVLEKLGWPRNIIDISNGNTYINAIPSSEHNKSMDDRLRWNCLGKIVPHHEDLCSIQEPLVRLYNRGAFLDVFHFYDLGDNIVTIPEGHRAEISKKDFFPLRPCLFMGVEVWCPNNPLKLLSDWYGSNVLKSIKKCKKGRWL